MKEPFTTNSFGNVSCQDNPPNKHMRKKLNARAKVKSVRTSDRREKLRILRDVGSRRFAGYIMRKKRPWR